jgi:hypothetical protein
MRGGFLLGSEFWVLSSRNTHTICVVALGGGIFLDSEFWVLNSRNTHTVCVVAFPWWHFRGSIGWWHWVGWWHSSGLNFWILNSRNTLSVCAKHFACYLLPSQHVLPHDFPVEGVDELFDVDAGAGAGVIILFQLFHFKAQFVEIEEFGAVALENGVGIIVKS